MLSYVDFIAMLLFLINIIDSILWCRENNNCQLLVLLRQTVWIKPRGQRTKICFHIKIFHLNRSHVHLMRLLWNGLSFWIAFKGAYTTTVDIYRQQQLHRRPNRVKFSRKYFTISKQNLPLVRKSVLWYYYILPMVESLSECVLTSIASCIYINIIFAQWRWARRCLTGLRNGSLFMCEKHLTIH